ncbi:MAG: site-specific integrase [Tannerella sp.]|jgi:integrase|nr:site-specific integrase [Tannerella sp.]
MNFKAVTRTRNEYNKVYIRISGKDRVDYIPTAMTVHKSVIRKGEITDSLVLSNCAIKIKQYLERLNGLNTEEWSVREIKQFLMDETELSEISFTDYVRQFINTMRNDGRNKPADNYQTAVNSLKAHMKRENFSFADLTAQTVREWIKSLSHTARAKNMYPNLMRTVFESGQLKYNDYDRNIIRIGNQPFKAVKIPSAEQPKERFASPDVIKLIFAVKSENRREELAHDTGLIILMLAGINTVDLYRMDKTCLKGEKLCYNREKTKGRRKDKAYFEITIRKELLPLLEKYKSKETKQRNRGKLFSFSERYGNEDNFTRALNTGLKSLCERAEKPEITVYWLRHAWATIARNQCKASMEEVAFCLNHSSAHSVTEVYIKKDFSIVDELNGKVLDIIFKEE